MRNNRPSARITTVDVPGLVNHPVDASAEAMTTRINYDHFASNIDYSSLNLKLELLKSEEPPKTRLQVSDLLKPLFGNLRDLRAKGWTYAQLANALKTTGPVIKESTLREYLVSQGKRDRKQTILKT